MVLQVFQLFMWLWVMNFIIGLGQVTLAGAFASYYWAFNKKKDLSRFPVASSFCRSVRLVFIWSCESLQDANCSSLKSVCTLQLSNCITKKTRLSVYVRKARGNHSGTMTRQNDNTNKIAI